MSSKRHRIDAVKLASNHRVDTSITDEAIFNTLSAFDCPRSLTVWLLYSCREHQQLADLGFDPLAYENFGDFRDAYQATNFLSKSNFLKLDVSKKDAAITKFLEFEDLCGKTNMRLNNLSLDPQYKGPNVWLLNATIRKIDEILGSYSADEFVDNSNWGPGVTTLTKGSHVSAFNKFQSESGITRRLYDFIEPWFSSAYPLWADSFSTSLNSEGKKVFCFQMGNEIITVPKNSKTDRVIAVEPGINLWFQKGIGTMIRRRLRRRGVDLNSQVLNQQLAKLGSQTGELATVDFSSASDSISRELVRTLLRPDWFLLLDICRSTVGTQNGTPIIWKKFSSMGNGFTFELESLIFFAAALAVTDYLQVSSKDVSVFGDDVIIPSNCFELFESFCAFLGFKVNTKKSFSSGNFRESCGSHYYSGLDVKPIFLKEKLTNVQSLYKLANSVRMLAHRRNSHCGCDVRFRRSWRHLSRGIPKLLSFGIPVGYGDSGLIMNFDEVTPSCKVKAKHGIEGYYFKGLIDTGVNQFSEKSGMLLARLWGRSVDREYNNNYTLRGRTRMRISLILAHQWYNLGDWI